MPTNPFGSFSLPRNAVAQTGAETVQLKADGDPKAGLTPIGTITATDTKLPLFLAVKGLTRRYHK
jgi:hypothetical protein